MKLKNIFTALLAGLTLFTACDKNEDLYLSEVRVSSSYVAIPIEGGNQEITITANDSWSINLSDKDAKWLTVSPVSGAAGDTKVVFSAAAGTSTNSTTLKLVCAGKTQLINVLQQAGKVELPISKSTEVNASEDGTTWRIKGTVRGIENTTYGNYYIDDEYGSVYVYGTLNNGEAKKFASLGIEAGDIITVQGKKSTYNGPQLVNVDVIAIEKSLIKVEEVDPENAELPKEGGVINVTLTVKGDGVMAVVPDAAKSWLSVGGIAVDGTLAVVQLVAVPNEGGDRSVQITFMTPKGNKEYTAVLDVTQKGAIIDATAAEINAAEDGPVQYRITGVVSKIANTKYGNLYIKDATGEVFVYGTNDFAASGIEEDDIITVVGPKTSHNDAPQMKNVTVENRIPVQDIDLASFRALEDNKNAWYKISGKVVKSSEEGTKFDLTQYGNFALSDGTTEVYVYGVKTGWGGEKGKFGTLGIKEGDELTIVCYKTSHKGLVEADGCFYVSHKSGSDSPEQPVDPQPAESETITMSDCFSADANTELVDGETYTWGSLSVKFTKNNTSASHYNVKDGGLRFYASDVMTISAEKDIVKLEFVTYGSKKGPFTANVGEVAEGDTVIWTGETKSVELTAVNQIRIKEIKVTYKK